MSLLESSIILVLVLGGLIASLMQMGFALEEADLEEFLTWTCIASLLACAPTIL